MLTERIRAILEHALERPLRLDEDAGYPSLDQLPIEVLTAAKQIQAANTAVAVHAYLMHVVPAASHSDVTEFIEEVLEGGHPAETWRVGSVLFSLDLRAEELLRLTVEQATAMVEGAKGERWYRIVPDRQGWARSSAAGAPGIFVRTANHTHRPVPHTRATSCTVDLVEPVAEKELKTAFRRWMASQVRSRLSDLQVANHLNRVEAALQNPVTVAAVLRLPLEELSQDGRAAIRGLCYEHRSFHDSNDDRAPGFRAPDEIYSSP